MDFSLKQALGVALLIAVAVIVLGTAITLSTKSTDKVSESTTNLLNQATVPAPAH